jgi:hypothetical protein
LDLFEVILSIHIGLGVICLLSGMVSMFAAKKKGGHTKWGEVYHGAYAALAATAIMLAIWKWNEIAYLFYIAVFSYGLAIYGYAARKQKWTNWLQHHIRGMLGSYIGAVTALLVNVGDSIPLLHKLPALSYWFLPTIVDSALIYVVTRRYRKNASVSKKISY